MDPTHAEIGSTNSRRNIAVGRNFVRNWNSTELHIVVKQQQFLTIDLIKKFFISFAYSTKDFDSTTLFISQEIFTHVH